jgi:hypothetical protein
MRSTYKAVVVSEPGEPLRGLAMATGVIAPGPRGTEFGNSRI